MKIKTNTGSRNANVSIPESIKPTIHYIMQQNFRHLWMDRLKRQEKTYMLYHWLVKYELP